MSFMKISVWLKISFKKINFSKQIRRKIYEKLDTFNRSNISADFMKKEKEESFSQLPEKYISWNNREVQKIQKITNLDLEDWII